MKKKMPEKTLAELPEDVIEIILGFLFYERNQYALPNNESFRRFLGNYSMETRKELLTAFKCLSFEKLLPKSKVNLGYSYGPVLSTILYHHNTVLLKLLMALNGSEINKEKTLSNFFYTNIHLRTMLLSDGRSGVDLIDAEYKRQLKTQSIKAFGGSVALIAVWRIFVEFFSSIVGPPRSDNSFIVQKIKSSIQQSTNDYTIEICVLLCVFCYVFSIVFSYFARNRMETREHQKSNLAKIKDNKNRLLLLYTNTDDINNALKELKIIFSNPRILRYFVEVLGISERQKEIIESIMTEPNKLKQLSTVITDVLNEFCLLSDEKETTFHIEDITEKKEK